MTKKLIATVYAVQSKVYILISNNKLVITRYILRQVPNKNLKNKLLDNKSIIINHTILICRKYNKNSNNTTTTNMANILYYLIYNSM